MMTCSLNVQFVGVGNMKHTSALALGILLLGNHAVAQLEFSGTVEQMLAINSNDGSTQMFETTFKPRIDFDISNDIRMKATGRVRLETQGELGFSGNNKHSDFELRELYIDTEWGASYWRIGKQQVVWGQADGLRVLDVVNPFDFREFILPEFEDRRIPLWTVNVELPLNDDWTAQLLWMPDQTYDEFPESDEVYALTSPLLVPEIPEGVAVSIHSIEKPNNWIKDSDVGGRLSAFLNGWDISLNYLYHYQDQPVFLRYVNAQSIDVVPGYERTHLFGGSASNVFGDTTFRAEVGYSTDRYFLSSDRNDIDGVVRVGEFSYVLGIDYQGFRDWFISAQVFQSIVDHSSQGLIRDSVDTSATLLVRRTFLNESVQTEALLIQSLNNNDGVMQASLQYEWSSNIQLVLATDVFFGFSEGLYGQFNEESRVSMGIEVSY